MFEQGQRIGGEVVQSRVAQSQGRLCLSWGLLLAQDVGNVIGAERELGKFW